MNFLNDYKEGGEKNKETGNLGGYTYLSKQCEQDVVLEVNRAFVKVSENPRTKGAEKAIFEFFVREATTTQEGLVVGDIVSYMINLTPKNDLGVEPALKEFVQIMSAITGTAEKDYFKSIQLTPAGKVSLLEEHLEDDAAAFKGTKVQISTPDKPNKGWYNLVWEHIEPAAQTKKGRKAS